MATTQEAIARLRMIFETQGAEAAVAEMKKLETAETSLGTSSLNLDRAFTNLERRYNETARATADYERAMRTLNAAVAQNPALAERAAAVQQTLAARYQASMQAVRQAGQAQTAYGQVSQALGAQAQGLAASTGLLGSVFSTLGKGGLAAAVGVGALYLAYEKLDAGVTKTAQYARDVSHFAEATGLTTSQVQGLNKEAARFGISSDELRSGIERFTAGFAEVRNGGGAMLDVLRRIDPELARQAVSAGSETEALTIVGEALRRATNEFDRAALARAAFGRGGGNIGLMVKDLDLNAVTEKYKDRGLSQAVIEDLKKLQSEIDARGTNIENKIYGYFGKPWLEAKNNILAYIEAVLKIEASREAAAKGKSFSESLRGSMLDLVDIAEGVSKVSDETKEAIADQERLADAFKQTAAAAQQPTAAPNPKGQVQFEMGAVAPGTYDRQLEAIKAIKAEYPGLVAQDAIRLKQLDEQLRIAEAMPGLVRMEAEERARITQLQGPGEGKDLELAMTIAAKERAVAQAQINSAAEELLAGLRDQFNVASAITGVQKMQAQAEATYNQLVRQGVSAKQAQAIAAQQLVNAQAQVNAGAQQQLLNLQNQYAVAAAVTGQEKIRAQEQATINSLLQQGVDIETATAVAAQERANAEAAVNAQIQQQIYKLNEATELIEAKMADGLSRVMGVNEMNVRVQQAFNDAIRQGASYADALALSLATARNLEAQREMQKRSAKRTIDEEDEPKLGKYEQTAVNQMLQDLQEAAKAGSGLAQMFLSGGKTPTSLVNNRDLPSIVAMAQQEVAFTQAQMPAQERLASLQNQYRLGAAATPQEKAQIQAQITYEDLIKQGVASDLAHQVANQELANAMQQLKDSVDANTTALQDQLDPIYTEGRAALRIGYYGEGSGGTMRTVTGTGYNTPANENTQAPGGNLIVINNNFPAGAVMGDRRTQLQAANSYGRALNSTFA